MPTNEKKGAGYHRILYSLLILLLAVGVIPLGIFGWTIIQNNREELETNQKFLQYTIAQSISDEVQGFVRDLKGRIDEMAMGFDLAATLTSSPELLQTVREAHILESFLRQNEDFLKIAFLAVDGVGWQTSVGEYTPNEVVEKLLLQDTIDRARNRESMVSAAIPLPSLHRSVMVFSSPVLAGEEPIGSVAALASLEAIQRKVEEVSRLQLFTVYLMDSSGNVIAHSDRRRIGVQADIKATDIAQHFLQNYRKPLKYTTPFDIQVGAERERMLGSYSTIPELGWGVFVEVEESKAFYPVYRMRRSTLLWSAAALLLAIVLGTFFAGRISRPIHMLAGSALSLAEGDFTQKVQVKTKNEIGQLAQTFNFMAEEIRKHIERIREAARENQELFMSSIQMLAAAIDEKDPYTRGHSARVTDYSVAIARNMGLSNAEIEKVRIASLLHDVGKIGVDDQILKKPGDLTPGEYEEMKKHPEKGATIMSPVKQLKSIIPVMRYHHERVDGSGYPEGLRGNEIPLAAQILSIADTFDAMTTDRPYQKAMEPNYVVQKIKGWSGIRYRPEVVAGFVKAFEKGQIRREGSPRSVSRS
jgi:HD-GYP domain-containing protein (c-di-GMP phosphodiesterase class II)